MKCPNCNREVSEEWSICPFCKFEPVKCPNCDSGWLPQDAKFCPSCGCSLDDSSFDVDEDDSLRCPYCGSDDVTDDGTNYLQYQCNKCSRRWGGTDDELDDDDEVVVCPECGSDDVSDDGSGCLQYECNKCGHKYWGNRYSVKCPECDSDNIWDDGSDHLQYKCLDCGHIWGDDEDEEGEDEIIDDKNNELHKFFPVAGIVLGETKVAEILKHHNLYDSIDYYSDYPNKISHDSISGSTVIIYKGQHFWRDRNEMNISHIYMTRGEMFMEWLSLGFDWKNSYSDWKNIFLRREYKVIVKKEPHTEYWAEEHFTYLSAEFVAIAPDSSILFLLNFAYGRDGYFESSPRTLYSIKVLARKSSMWNDYAL